MIRINSEIKKVDSRENGPWSILRTSVIEFKSGEALTRVLSPPVGLGF